MNIAKLMRVSALALLAPAITACGTTGAAKMELQSGTLSYPDGSHMNFGQARVKDTWGQDGTQMGMLLCASHMVAPDGSDLAPAPSATQIPGMTSPALSDTKCVASMRQTTTDGAGKVIVPSVVGGISNIGSSALFGLSIRPSRFSNETNVSNQGGSVTGGSVSATAAGGASGNTNVTANAAGGAGGKADAMGGSAISSAKGGDAKSYSDSHSSATQSQAQSQSQSQAQSQSQTATAPQSPPPTNHGGGDDHGGGDKGHGYGDGGQQHGGNDQNHGGDN